MADVAVLDIKVRTADVKGATKDLDSLTASGTRVEGATKRLTTSTDTLNESAKKLNSSFGSGNLFGGGTLGQISMVTAKVMLLQQALQMVVQPIIAIAEASIKFEKLQIGFAAIAGGADNAAETLSFVRKEADRLGVNFLSVADAYKKFIAATASSGTSLEELRNIFTSFTEAGVVLGSTTQDQTRIFNALQQMYSKTFVSAEELRQQLGDSLPGAISLMAEAMGVSEMRLMKMMEQNQVLAREAIPALSKIIKQVYGKDIVDASNTGESATNRMVNAWDRFKASLADSEAITGTLNLLTSMLNAAAGIASFLMGRTDESLRTTSEMSERMDELRKKENNALYDDERRVLRERRIALERRRNAEMEKADISSQRAATNEERRLKNASDDAAAKEAEEAEKKRKKAAPGIARAAKEAEDLQRKLSGMRMKWEDERGKAYLDARQSIYDEENKLKQQQLEDAYRIATEFDGRALELQKQTLREQYAFAAEFTQDKIGLAKRLEEELKKLDNQRLATSKNAWDGAKVALGAYAEDATNSAKNMGRVFTNAFTNMEDALVKFTMTGKFEFKSLVNSILSDLIRMQIREQITGKLAGGINSGSLWSGITGLFGFNHGGGMVGSPTFSRQVPLAAFAGAERFHSGGFPGLKSDEVPIIAQRGERVLSRKEVAAGAGCGGGTQTVTVFMKDSRGNQTAAPQTFNTNGMREFILNVVRDGSERGLLGSA